jgi:hypothetical protein
MSIVTRHPALIAAIALTACALSGCGTINGYLASGMSDYMPQWLGGMPADAPPRPGTPKYEEYMKERERKRLEPAPNKDDTATKAPASSAEVY